MKDFAGANTQLKQHLEDLEQYIMQTSETVNEKLEEIDRQMTDLHGEIKSNIELVKEKRRQSSAHKETKQFITVLCEDVKQFL